MTPLLFVREGLEDLSAAEAATLAFGPLVPALGLKGRFVIGSLLVLMGFFALKPS